MWKWKWSRSVVSDSLLPMDCSPPSSSVHGILQARILEWVTISFSRGSSRPRDWTRVSHIGGRRFNLCKLQKKRDHFPTEFYDPPFHLVWKYIWWMICHHWIMKLFGEGTISCWEALWYSGKILDSIVCQTWISIQTLVTWATLDKFLTFPKGQIPHV